MGERLEVSRESGVGSGHGNATWTEATASLCKYVTLSRRSLGRRAFDLARSS
jgi:hypothetical protein